MKQLLSAFFALTLLTACAGKAPESLLTQATPEQMYEKAMSFMDDKRYREAVPIFEDLERKHPYSKWSTKGKVMAIYAHYEMERYGEAIESADQFMRLHPGYPELDYVYYMKGLSYYNRISDVKRDQEESRKALDVFVELQKRYPRSEYAEDVQKKILLCLDYLAGQEMTVARFYQKQGRFIGAINRYQHVVRMYEQTSHVPEALFRMTEVNLSLGLRSEAQKAAAILGHNFPESKWYNKAYGLMVAENLAPAEARTSWFTRFKKGLTELF